MLAKPIVMALCWGLVSGMFVSAAPAAERRVTVVDDNGTVHVRRAVVPLSDLLSPASRAAVLQRVRHPVVGSDVPIEIEPRNAAMVRRSHNERRQPMVEAMRKHYPVSLVRQEFQGITGLLVAPEKGVRTANDKRILINLPGGGFEFGTQNNGLLMSIPMAAAGGYRVFTFVYRQGPEHRYPAATEDVVRVYSALLEHYAAQNIGIFGCSAGGTLTAQVVVELNRLGLPAPGAAGIYCAGASADWTKGDSGIFSRMLLPTGPQGSDAGFYRSSYFAGLDLTDPRISPENDVAQMAVFPPTIFFNGTRDATMSSAAYSFRQLRLAGVAGELFIYDGLGHGFMTDPELPESREVYRLAADFFDRHLGR